MQQPLGSPEHDTTSLDIARSRDRVARFMRAAQLVCLAFALLAPNCFGLWAAIRIDRSTTAAREAGALPHRLSVLRHWISSEELLAQQYREQLDAVHRVGYREAAAGALQAMGQLGDRRDPASSRMIADVARAYSAYADASRTYCVALGENQSANALTWLREHNEVTFAKLQADIAVAIDRALARESFYNSRQRKTLKAMLAGGPLVLLLDCGLVLLFLLVRRSVLQRTRSAALREAQLVQRSERRFRALVQNASDLILIAAPSGILMYQSPNAASGWGYGGEALSGLLLRELIHPDDQAALLELFELLVVSPHSIRDTALRLRLGNGSWRHVELILTNLIHDDSVGGIVLTLRDIEERKAFERQLTQRAFFDSLTGLANRLLLQDRLDQALARASRRGCLTGLVFIDLDNFKLINDGLGHAVGDELLAQTAARLSACGRAEDTVARLGGDEFVVLLDCLRGEADARAVAENVTRAFGTPFRLDQRDIMVTASIGVALGESGHATKETLLRDADVAMYRAKTDGKARYAIFDASMHKDSLARLEIENDLRQAIARGELRIRYQPIVEITTGRLVEVEALVRWQHPVRGLIPPAEFIPVAEETGLIIPLGQWVLEEACRQAVVWRDMSGSSPPVTLSVNLSPRQFQEPDLDSRIAATLLRTGIQAGSLKLEITEGIIMRDVEQTITMLDKLKALGIKLAVDDFGTGYSSLAYLKRLPLDVLKIDRSFVSGLGVSQEDTAIVQAIMSLAKSLNLSVTGEGIETVQQAETLRQMECNLGQGYYYARPLLAETVTEMLSGVQVVAADGPVVMAGAG